ncbi:hypothetical protein C1645_822932 [Glomus cerebriforme]|uniref:Uncharacterized protein n=1 Tax=Glomus cerebriforme TaxID=658196 RepID=A0A397SXT3_9GLOM|nr:hypothetical protein C1645_822932 [Glomus cerebriforme]
MSKYRRSVRLHSLLSPPFINKTSNFDSDSYKSETELEYESEYENEYKSEDKSGDESENEQDDRDEVIEIKETVLSACVVSCIGQYACEALKVYQPIYTRAFDDIKRPKSICCLCNEKLGGHIYHRPGKEKKGTPCLHLEHTSKGIEFLDNWLIDISQTQNEKIKEQILIALISILTPFASFSFFNKKTFIESDSNSTNTNIDNFNYTSTNTSNINEKLIITQLPRKKIKINNRQQHKRQKPITIISYEQITKIITFITSVLIGLAFPFTKIWLPQILSSLVCKPRLFGSLHRLLTIFYVTSHTDRYERKLANFQMEKADPTHCLVKEKNIWNLAIIDNINFKDKNNGTEEIVELTADTPLFGINSGINKILLTFQEVFQELLDLKNINGKLTYRRNFDAESVKRIILSKLDHRYLGPLPNIIILESGNNPNSDEEILRSAEMYKKDFSLENYDFLDIWHTSKDFCSVLIVLFSSYGLLSLASRLGVRFLDKFELAVDYRSTTRILDLLWVAVEIAINIYINSKKIPFSEIIDGKNDTNICLKVWYLYYKWAGIWKAHKMGVRVGNFDIQRDSLAAAGPLFASAVKSNYITAIAYFLASLATHLRLKEKLNHAGSFKIPHENNDSHHTCFGFDEALKTFGIKFIKKNITGNIIDDKNLKNQIKACQDERKRIDLLMESLWNLVDNLIEIFEMPNPLSYCLFQEYLPIQLHQQGVKRLITCYHNGLEWIKAVYWQEVLKIECRNTWGRRAVEVVRTKFKDYSEQKKAKRKIISQPQDIPQKEEKILEELLVYKEDLPDSAVDKVLHKLSNNWNKTKVKAAWRYRKTKASINNNK